jgi:hypothetical protein
MGEGTKILLVGQQHELLQTLANELLQAKRTDDAEPQQQTTLVQRVDDYAIQALDRHRSKKHKLLCRNRGEPVQIHIRELLRKDTGCTTPAILDLYDQIVYVVSCTANSILQDENGIWKQSTTAKFLEMLAINVVLSGRVSMVVIVISDNGLHQDPMIREANAATTSSTAGRKQGHGLDDEAIAVYRDNIPIYVKSSSLATARALWKRTVCSYRKRNSAFS